MNGWVLLLFLFVSVVGLGQVPQPNLLSLYGYGGLGTNNVNTIVTKTNGGGFIVNIITDATRGTGNIDTFCSSSITGERNIFLKFNASASALEWSKCSTAGYILFPQTDGSFVFGGVTNAVPSGWAFQITKEDAAGTILWSKTYGGAGASARTRGMIATADGGFIMEGITNYSDTDFTVHYGSFTKDDIAIVKVDSQGNKVWSRVIGGTADDVPVAIINGPGDGCYIVGTTLSYNNDFIGNHGGNDAFVVRLDKDGAIVWLKNIGGTGGDQANCAATNGKGGVVIGGASNSLDGDRTHFPPFGCPVWALEVDSNQNVLWNNCFGGGGGNCYPNSICKATDGSVWLAGVSSYKGAYVDTAFGSGDVWIVHINDTGGFINAKVLGSDYDDRGYMVYPLSNNNVMAGGFFGISNGSFEGMNSYGSAICAFLTILAPTTVGISELGITEDKYHIYPNPAKSELNIANAINATVVLYSMIGRPQLEKRCLKDKDYIDISSLLPGMYLLELNSPAGGVQHRRFLKE